jgi:prolyl-tRNA synthetase
VALALFEVAVVIAQSEHAEAVATGERIYRQLCAVGVEAIVDDRPERAGVKFRDVELTGIAFRVTVGTRGLAEGSVEVTERATGQTWKVPVDQVVEYVRQAVRAR